MFRIAGVPSLVVALAGVPACGGESAPDASAGTTSAVAAPVDPTPASILARARASITEGRVAPELVDALADSTEPGATRASRLLAAFDAAEPPPRPPSSDPVVTPTVPPADPDAAAEPEATPISATPITPTPKPEPAPRREVERLRFVKKDRGAQLVIDASASVTVGVVHQHEQGIVRLVVEKSSAAAAALSSLPSTKGVRVTGVRKGPGTVQITLALEPGWTIGTVRSSGRGAKVDLRPPP